MSFSSWETNQRTGRRGLPEPGIPRPQSPNAPRIDPNDGLAYTYAEILEYYEGLMARIDVVKFWNTMTPKIPKRLRRRAPTAPPQQQTAHHPTAATACPQTSSLSP